jgi:glutathione S-transferase
MQLYGHPWSIHTREIRMVLAEKRQPATLVLVDLPRGEQRSPEHLARHPFGKVPVLDDAGQILYETAAIARYLDEVVPGSSLWPTSPRSRAQALQWDRVNQSYFAPHAHPLIVQVLFMRHLGGTRDDAVVEACRTAILPALDVLDRHLSSAPFLAGDAFSLADITWMPFLDYLHAIGEGAPIRERPGVAAWWERLAARPTWIEVAHSGPQPYDPGAGPDDIVRRYR